MGCVMACFRIKDGEDRRKNPLSRWIRFNKKGCLPWRKQQAASWPKREDKSPLCDAEPLETGLVHEGKFLKDYAAAETHAKKRKGFGEIIGPILDDNDCTYKKLPCNEEHHQLSSSPKQAHFNEESSFSENNSTGYTFSSVASSKPMYTEGEPESRTLDISPYQNSGQVKPLDSAQSPYPTPIRITDELQTPYTVYPENKENPRARMNSRIPSQYVFPVLNPVENLPRWSVPIETSAHTRENSTKLQQFSPVSLRHESPNYKIEGISTDSAASLCKWVTPVAADSERGCSAETGRLLRDPQFIEDSEGDGFVAENGSFVNSPILWEGNGIPNTTSKYKEDQKVTWHATPFVERLEKVLYHDKLLPPRVFVEGKPTIVEDEGKGSERKGSEVK